ncbi:hypothetical protein TH25_13610 [Thalassospira profundimaris]|uniref:DUF4168 domain-containing protein n=1 Tax=Thalassospira profundimaris TaxID=502049 RepID=A0A367X4P9_9PROT|nr:hypothetical protein [Thalassospira profundimaris]RCK48648.1 hypothetical protein TH25_13610 [Thalassospira profundimaris]
MFKAPGKIGIIALAMTLFVGVATSFPAAAADSQSTLRADITKVTAGHKLTADELDRMTNVVTTIKSDPEAYNLRAKKPESFDEMVENLNNSPNIKELLDKNGFTAREYLITSMTLARSAVASRVGPDNMPDVNPDNVEFVRQHQDKVDALMKTRR